MKKKPAPTKNNVHKEIKNFGLIIGLIFIIIGLFFLWKNVLYYQIFMGIGITLFITGLTIPVILKPIYFLWMTFANILGRFMTHLIICFIYFAVITPIGLILRLFGKQFLDNNLEKSDVSYWGKRNDQINKNNYEKQF